MYKMLNSEIFSTGTIVINPPPPTKININKNNTYIDHIFTNVPKKIHGQTIIRNGFSDHYLIIFFRKSKNPKSHPSFYTTRDYKNVNWDLICNEMENDIRLTNASLSNSSQEISELIIQSVTDHLENQAPITRRQNKQKTPTFATAETKQLINDRDNALKLAKITKSQDDYRDFKHKRNLVHKSLYQDKTE